MNDERFKEEMNNEYALASLKSAIDMLMKARYGFMLTYGDWYELCVDNEAAASLCESIPLSYIGHADGIYYFHPAYEGMKES